MKNRVKFPIIFALVSVTVGCLAAVFTKDNRNIYDYITLPVFAPPAWIFPVVWVILYILMGVSAGLMWTAPRKDHKKPGAQFYFFLQLGVNFFWSIIFFNFMAFKASFVWLILLLGLIIIMFLSFFKISKISAYLLLPYIIWVIFAGALNLSIALLNP